MKEEGEGEMRKEKMCVWKKMGERGEKVGNGGDKKRMEEKSKKKN